MLMFIIQTAILIAIAYLLGCVAGSLLRAVSRKPEAPKQKDEVKTRRKKASAAKSGTNAKKPPKQRKPAMVTTVKDDLKQIRGIGPKIEERLNGVGIVSFSQVAAWKPKDQREIGEKLAFKGRIEREDWVKQARLLVGKRKA
ncbi:MAG: hypothetical protein ACR2O3_11880 [Rhizobiaceae bacterium]